MFRSTVTYWWPHIHYFWMNADSTALEYKRCLCGAIGLASEQAKGDAT